MGDEHVSPDGRWRWNGMEWVPVEQPPEPQPEPQAVEDAPLGTFDEEMRGALRMERRASRGDPQVPASMRTDVLAKLRRPVRGQRRIAVISRKGGVGKTTTTLMLGHIFAFARGDRVLALDANPDAGSLAHRVHKDTELSVNDVLRQPGVIDSYVEMRSFTSQAPSRLEVLASDQDPLLTEGLGHDEYARVLSILRLHYGVVLCDTGTGVLDPSTRGILSLADQVVICTAAALDAYRAALRTLEWLEQHGFARLARGGVVVVNAVQSGTPVDVRTMELELTGRCRAVVRVPWDEKLWAGAETGFDELGDATQRAYVRVAEAVAEGFDEAGGGEDAPAPAPLPASSVAGPDGAELSVEVISWRGGTALVGRDRSTAKEYALEFPRVVRGGRDVEGRWLSVHRTRAMEVSARVAVLRRSAENPIDVRLVLDAPGIAEDGGAGGRPVYLLEARAARRSVRVLLCTEPARVLGVDVAETMGYRPVEFVAEQVNVPGLVERGWDVAGHEPVEVVETDLRLVAATLVTDEQGTPVAVDVPGLPEAWTLTF